MFHFVVFPPLINWFAFQNIILNCLANVVVIHIALTLYQRMKEGASAYHGICTNRSQFRDTGCSKHVIYKCHPYQNNINISAFHKSQAPFEFEYNQSFVMPFICDGY
jgi:hypothetical protein